jgi:phage shock protein C
LKPRSQIADVAQLVERIHGKDEVTSSSLVVGSKKENIMPAVKKLYKHDTDRKLDGVCAGLGEYFDIDPTLVRVGYAFITLITGFFPGAIAYIIMALIMPTKSESK